MISKKKKPTPKKKVVKKEKSKVFSKVDSNIPCKKDTSVEDWINEDNKPERVMKDWTINIYSYKKSVVKKETKQRVKKEDSFDEKSTVKKERKPKEKKEDNEDAEDKPKKVVKKAKM